jgi:hypothetical protein
MSQHSEQTPDSAPNAEPVSALIERLHRLEVALAGVEQKGMDGSQLAQRVRGDLERLMSSAWLNCTDLSARYDREQEGLHRWPRKPPWSMPSSLRMGWNS